MSDTGPRACGAIVVGGGISGLTTALYLHKAGLAAVLFEASDRPGGAIRTWREGQWLFELGPNTVLASDPSFDDLIANSGLDTETITASPLAQRRFILKRGKLIPLPSGPSSFFTSPLFSWKAKVRLFKEPFVPRAVEEESIAAFVRRRLGSEFLDYAVGPFVSGVYAGDPERLSVRHAVRRVYELEKENGSLIRGALAKMRAARRTAGAGQRATSTARAGGAMGRKGRLVSLREGLARLPSRLAERLEDHVHLRERVECIRRDGSRYLVEVSGPNGSRTAYSAPLLASSVDASEVARILAPLDADGRLGLDLLKEVPYAPLAVVALGYRREDVSHPLDGFGFLVPRTEGLRVLGCLFTSTMFDDRAPEGHVTLTAFVGGATDPETAGLPEDRLVELVASELAPPLGITGNPAVRRVLQWPRAIPQYNMGHGRFVAIAEAAEAAHPGLHLIGNWRHGVSVGDCIAQATELARRLSPPGP